MFWSPIQAPYDFGAVFGRVGQRTINSSTGYSRNIVSEVVQCSPKYKLGLLDNNMIRGLSFSGQATEKGYFPVDLEKTHKELQKKNVTLALLHQEYAEEAR